MTTELREILARNLRQLMRDRYDLDTQVKIRERSKQYTADGKGLAGLYDDLPNDANLRARMYHHLSGFLLNPETLPATPSSAEPAPTASPEKQRG
jgi:hypothetical protein